MNTLDIIGVVVVGLLIIFVIVSIIVNISKRSHSEDDDTEESLANAEHKLRHHGYSQSEIDKRLNYARNHYETGKDGMMSAGLMALILSSSFDSSISNEDNDNDAGDIDTSDTSDTSNFVDTSSSSDFGGGGDMGGF